MLAITHDHYTDAEGLELREIDRPEPGPNELLIKVAAAALNPFDWHAYRGDPYIMRIGGGLRVTEPRVIGADLAGTVVAMGAAVEGFAVGDRVVAEPGSGGCAEYAIADARCTVVMPESVSFEVAVAALMGGLTSLQALRDKATLKPRDRVLVWGASGGVGHVAIQIARALGARRVDAVCSDGNVAMVRELGADRAYDYNAAGVTGADYDVILDTVCTESTRTLRDLLSENGRVVTLGALGGGKVLGPLGPLLRRALGAKLHKVNASIMFADANMEDMATLMGWLADGTVKPVIARVSPLAQTADACRELERGHVAGKLVITVP